MKEANCIILVSGGVDSTTLLYKVLKEGKTPLILTFDYGQKHKKEIVYAMNESYRNKLEHITIRIPKIKGSALTDLDVDMTDKQSTVVPNRNMIFLSHAVSIAIDRDITKIYFAAHKSDFETYPDCRPAFIESLNKTIAIGNYESVKVITPFINMTKAEIITLAHSMELNFEEMWSCYNGGKLHCGICPTCIERKAAFIKAKIYDPTDYLTNYTT